VFNIESQGVRYWNLFIQARAFSDIQKLPSSLLFSMFPADQEIVDIFEKKLQFATCAGMMGPYPIWKGCGPCTANCGNVKQPSLVLA
jgi:hypothetical protein